MNGLAVSLFALALFGCATMANDNRIARIPIEIGNSMASDSLKQLQTRYPPAQTEFIIDQPVSKQDVFGTSLVFKLRETGYAVQAYPSVPDNGSTPGIRLHYSVDKPATPEFTELYSVKLAIGETILTRAYTARNQLAVPVSAWAIRE